MQRFFSILAEAVTRFEGTVDKFTGDGIMAVFGAPVAHEDHARRACYAALQMLDDVAEYAAELRRGQGAQLLDPDRDQLRRGRRRGDRRRRRLRLHGDRPHGRPGAADGGAGRARQGLPDREHRRAGPAATSTSTTSASSRSRARAGRCRSSSWPGSARRARASTSPASAASPASSAARQSWRGSTRPSSRAADGEASAVGVVAEAGDRQEPALPRVRPALPRRRGRGLRGAGPGARQVDPLHADPADAALLLRDRRPDPEQAAREKIAGRSLLLDPGFADDLPLVFDFLGVPDPERPVPQMSPEGRRRALGDFLCRLVSNPAAAQDAGPDRRGPALDRRGQPDDAARPDRGRWTGRRRWCWSTTGPSTRPPGATRRPIETIDLQPLDRDDTAELLRDLAGGDPSLDGLDEPIHERTGGNPFFIEEIVRELAESGYLEGERGAYRLARPIEDAGVPVTVQAVLAARIDRLDAEAKHLLQVASVVGKEVSGRGAAADRGARARTSWSRALRR